MLSTIMATIENAALVLASYTFFAFAVMLFAKNFVSPSSAWGHLGWVFLCASVGLHTYVWGLDDGRENTISVDRHNELVKERDLKYDLLSREMMQRSMRAAELAATVDEYEKELANGTTTSCVSDPAFDRRLRNILQGR